MKRRSRAAAHFFMPPQDSKQSQRKPRVLLVGWDGADLRVLNQLLDAGCMPNLARFV